MARVCLFFIATIVVTNVYCQFDNNFYGYKPGSCPPRLPVEICTRSCLADGHCRGDGKCCPTRCGGTICSIPVTMRKKDNIQKSGSCPNDRKGGWVCSSTCSTDGDCRGTKKCCKTRCGGYACRKPEIEVIESIEIPYVGVPSEIPYNDRQPNANPFFVYSN